MSAEVLRRAAREMRHDTFNGQTEDALFMEAVADLLESVAQNEDHVIRWMHGRSLAVARAYLGPDA